MFLVPHILIDDIAVAISLTEVRDDLLINLVGDRVQYIHVVILPRRHTESVYFLLYTSSFKSDILNSLITAFSILVGLLANLLMTVYTMTQKLKEEPQKTVMQKDIFKKKANFFKQFGYLTTYAILLSIVCIILSILNQCSTTEMLPIVELVKCEWSFTPQDILATSRIIFYGLIKASLVYFVLDLLYIVLFTVCSFIDYLNGEIKDIEESSEQ